MKIPSFVSALIPFLLLLACPAARAANDVPRVYVASTGLDSNPGTLASPKRNFAAALAITADGGEIAVLDTAGYGPMTISRSVSITVPAGVSAFINPSGSQNGVVVYTPPDAVVNLRGLIVEGTGGTNTNRTSGIQVKNVGHLNIEDCTLRGFYVGIEQFPLNSSHLSIHRTTLRGCSIGLKMAPANAQNESAVLDGCHIERNAVGVQAFNSSGAGGVVNVSLTGCVVSSNTIGLYASDAFTAVRVSDCTITDNDTGVKAESNGQILSRGNNTLENNASFNAFPGTYAPK